MSVSHHHYIYQI